MDEKIYPITKDGVQFEVRATSPEEAAAKARAVNVNNVARIIARQGTTRVMERPNGMRYVVSPGFSSTDPKAVESALAGMSAGDISKTKIDQDLLSQYQTAARAGEFVRGVPGAGSYLDEALGAVLGPEAGIGARALSGAMQRQRPGETLGLNLLGGLTTAAAGGAVAGPKRVADAYSAVTGTGSRAAQVARGALTSAAAGSTEGGLYGSGEGTTASERAESAASGATFGGVVGGLLGASAPFVEAGTANVVSLFRRSDVAKIAAIFGISTNAARVLKNTFEMGGDVSTAIARVQQAGAEGMVADAGDAAQALLDATAASGPAGASAARRPIEERMQRVSEGMDRGLTSTLGQPAEGPVTAVSEIMDRTRDQRASLYDQAYDTPIDYAAPSGAMIEDIVFRRVDPQILLEAVREANAEMIDRNVSNQQIMAQLAPDGTIRFREMPNVRQLDEIKKALYGLAKKARNMDAGMVPVDTAESLRYKRQAQDLSDALMEATGGPTGTYAAAVKVGGNTIQEREAFELGERLLSPRTRIEDVGLELGPSPSAAQTEAAKRGLRTRIEQVVGDVKRIPSDPNIDARQALATLREMGSDNAREKIRRVLGPQAADVLRLLDEGMVAAETRAAMAANSRTQIREASQQNVADLTAPGPAGMALQGEPINTTKAMIQAVTGYTNEFSAGQRQRVYQDLAKALTQKQGPDARAALAALDAAMQGQQLTDAQTDMLAKLVTSALLSASTPALGRETARQFGE